MRKTITAALLTLTMTTAALGGVKHIDTLPARGTVNVNTATAQQLALLPGVGPTTAAGIIAARPFKAVSDLLSVRGIGEKKLAALTPYVTVTGPTTATGKLRSLNPHPVVPR